MSLRPDMLQPGHSYVDMFAQLDTDPQHRPVLTRPVTRAGESAAPLTSKDYEAFASITPVEPPPPEDNRRWRPSPKVDLSHITEAQWRTMSDYRIARANGTCPQAVYRWRAKHNRPKSSGSTASAVSKYDYDLITGKQWATLTDKQVAAILGCTPCCVRQHRVHHDLPLVPGTRRSKIQWDLISRDQWATLTNKQIAAILGCNYSNVYFYRKTKLS